METKNLNDLQPNPRNPRQISKHDFEALKRSIKEFGDLSGIVFNNRTQHLVGGHQRIQSFKALGGDKNVVITQKFETPSAVGTVEIGYVEYNGERYGYRTVDWPEEKELTANVAANRIQGEFDLDLLAQITAELKTINPDLLELTGQTNDEIERLLQMSSAPEEAQPDDGLKRVSFELTEQQLETLEEALGNIRATHSFEGIANNNAAGNAVYMLAKQHLDRIHGQQ